MKGDIIDGESTDQSRLCEDALLDIIGIERGFLWSMIGWEVIEMPGSQPVPEVVYNGQVVQPPCLAWVDRNARDRDIVTSTSRMWKMPNADDAISVLAFHYQSMHKMAHRIVDMDKHWKRLMKRQKRRREEFDNYEPNDDDNDRTPPSLITYDENSMRFGRVLEEETAEVDTATKFQTDVVKILNPKSGTRDKIFCFPMTPYNETSHEGMKMTYSTMMESLQFVQADDQGQ